MPVCRLTRTPELQSTYLSALRRCQISMGNAITRPHLHAKISSNAGVAKAHVFSKGLRPERLPIALAILPAIKAVWNSSATEHDTIMNQAICTLVFFGFFW